MTNRVLIVLAVGLTVATLLIANALPALARSENSGRGNSEDRNDERFEFRDDRQNDNDDFDFEDFNDRDEVRFEVRNADRGAGEVRIRIDENGVRREIRRGLGRFVDVPALEDFRIRIRDFNEGELGRIVRDRFIVDGIGAGRVVLRNARIDFVDTARFLTVTSDRGERFTVDVRGIQPVDNLGRLIAFSSLRTGELIDVDGDLLAGTSVITARSVIVLTPETVVNAVTFRDAGRPEQLVARLEEFVRQLRQELGLL